MAKIILHIGMPKTGTTALQMDLDWFRCDLLKHGIYIPPMLNGNHDIIVGAYRSYNSISRSLNSIYNGDWSKVVAAFTDWRDRVLMDVDRYNPNTVVISGEAMFCSWDSNLDQLTKELSGIGEVITVVVYVRRPSEYYFSMAQQQLKGSGNVAPWYGMDFRAVVNLYRSFAPVIVVKYDKDSLERGSITADFIARFLPDAEIPVRVDRSWVNQSMSAESMAIMQRFRRTTHAGRDNIMTAESRILNAVLMRAGAKVGAAAPVLKPSLASMIDQAMPDLLWLREEYGISFDGIDYRKLSPIPNEGLLNEQPRVEELWEVDEDLVEELQMRALLDLTQCAGFSALERT